VGRPKPRAFKTFLIQVRCVKHWFKELDDPQAAGPSQAVADTPIGQSLLKLEESQRKRLESLFNTAYGVVKAGKPFSDYELICEIQVKNGLDQFIYP
jgi:hypothetical protein